MPQFRNDVNMFLLMALFYEVAPTKEYVIYTLKDKDHAGYKSLYRLYMECDDPTEYIFATTHLDGWEHWERLSNCKWFEPYVTRWRHELELRTRAKALQRIKAAALSGSKESFQADKLLLAGGWKDPVSKKRGAPTKAEVRSEAQRLAQVQSTLDDDFERIQGDASTRIQGTVN